MYYSNRTYIKDMKGKEKKRIKKFSNMICVLDIFPQRQKDLTEETSPLIRPKARLRSKNASSTLQKL